MDQELKDLLKKCDLEDQYIDNFEKARVLKVRTLKLLKDSSFAELIPDLGPRVDFMDMLRTQLENVNTSPAGKNTVPNVVDENGNGIHVIVVPQTTNRSDAVIAPSDKVPDCLMEDDPDAELAESSPTPGSQVLDESSPNPAPRPSPVNSNPRDSRRPGTSQSSSAKVWICPTNASHNLEILLNESTEGKIILAQYQLKQDLTEKLRNMLADLIIKEYLRPDLDKRFPREVEKAATGHILNQFSTEKKDVWQSPSSHRSKAEGRGKLLVRYYGKRRILMNAKLIQKAPSDAGLDPDYDNVFSGENPFTEEQRLMNEENDLWLKNNKHPWSKVEQLWAETSAWRVRKMLSSKVSIHDYMQQYPALKQPLGYMLLETDFDTMYPNHKMELYKNWPMLSAFLREKIPKKANDDVEDLFTADGKKIALLRALPYLFPVVTATKIKKNSKWLQWRASRQECADGLIMHVKDANDIMTDINTYRDKYVEFKLDLSPFAVMVGNDEDHITASYVCVNNFKYEVDDPIKAIDVVFKVIHALNAEYNVEVKREFLFLEMVAYDMVVKQGRSGANIKELKSAVENFKKFKSEHS